MKEIFLSTIVWVFGDVIPGLTGRMEKHGNLVSPDVLSKFTADDGSTVEMVMPGDRIKMTAELIYPVAIEEGMRFAIREGGRTIGAGVVSKIVE